MLSFSKLVNAKKKTKKKNNYIIHIHFSVDIRTYICMYVPVCISTHVFVNDH